MRKTLSKILKIKKGGFLNYHFLTTVLLGIVICFQAILLGFFIFKIKGVKKEIGLNRELQNQNSTIIKNILNQQRTTLWKIQGDIMKLNQ